MRHRSVPLSVNHWTELSRTVQILFGESLDACMDALADPASDGRLHLLDRINMSWLAEMSIINNVPNLAKFKVSGHLPELAVHFSDRKYQSLMRMIDITIPHFDDDAVNVEGSQVLPPQAAPKPKAKAPDAPASRRRASARRRTSSAGGAPSPP